MSKHYEGLPAAASVEQSIALAQRLILRDLERRAKVARDLSASVRIPEQAEELKKAS